MRLLPSLALCAVLGVAASAANTSRRSLERSGRWEHVGTVSTPAELADVLSSDAISVGGVELAQLALQSAEFLKDAGGPVSLHWSAQEKRLRLVGRESGDSAIASTRQWAATSELGARLNAARSHGDAAAILREFFDEAHDGSSMDIPARLSEIGSTHAPLSRESDLDDTPHAAPPAPHPLAAFAPHAVTGLNLASGVGALLYAAHGAVLPAAGLILLANVFDALDGRVARALGVSGPMGVELDSLADVVSFGAAPAVLVYQAALDSFGVAGFALAGLFAIAGAYRLARFNLQALGMRPASKNSDSFTGMPIPAGAGVLVSLVLALPLFPVSLSPWIAAPVTALASLAMVSTIPYPAFKKGGMRALLVPASLAAAAAIALAWLGYWVLIPAAVFGGYLLIGPALRHL